MEDNTEWSYDFQEQPQGDVAPQQQEEDTWDLIYTTPSDYDIPVIKDEVKKAVEKPIAQQLERSGITLGNYFESKSNEYVNSIKGDYQDFKDDVNTTLGFDIPYKERNKQLLGRGLNLATDVVGETVITGLGMLGDGLSWATPPSLSEPVKKGYEEGMKFISQSEAGKQGMDALGKGLAAWDEFKEKNPRAAANLESIVDISVVLYPTKKVADIKPVGDLGRKARQIKAGMYLDKQFGDKKPYLEMFLDTESADAYSRTLNGRVKLSPMEEKAVRALTETSSINPSKSPVKNVGRVNREIDRLNKTLTRSLASAENKVDLPSLYTSFEDSLDNLVAKSLEPEKAGKINERLIQVVQNSIAKNGSSAKGIWEARKALDNWFEKEKGDAAFNKKGDLVDAVYASRNALNEAIIRVVPDAKKNLDLSSGLLYAREGIADRASKEGGVLDRLLKNVTRSVGAHRDVAFALSGTLGVAYAASSAPIMLAAGATGASFLASKALYKYGAKPAKAQMATFLKYTDKAIVEARKARNSELLRQLRTDRAAFLTIMGDLEQTWQTGGGVAYRRDTEGEVETPDPTQMQMQGNSQSTM
jgi:hypothetical protein